MKGFLVFCGLTVLVAVVWVALPHLDNRDEAYEARLVGALNFVEAAVEASRPISVDIYDPEIQALAGANLWRLSGIMVSHDSVGKKERTSLAAVLESVCADSGNPECWRVEEFTLEGEVVSLARPTVTDESAAQSANGGADETQAASSAASTTSTTTAERVNGEGAVEAVASGEASSDTQPSRAALEAGPETSDGAAAESGPGEEGAAAESAAESAEPAPLPEMSREQLIRRIQEALTELRYEPGPIDGRYGSRTAAAILSYQRDKGLVPDGRASKDLLHHLNASVRELAQ